MEILKGKQKTPWSIIIYGVAGIGKSTMAAMAPNPLVIDLEGSVARINVDKTPRINDWDHFLEAIKLASASDYQTVVIDTVSGLENIMTKKILDDDGQDKTSLADFGYNRGFRLLASYYSLASTIVERLKAKGKNVALVGHETVEKVENPGGENFGRYTLQGYKDGTPHLINSVDAVLLNKFELMIRNKDEKDFSGKSKKQAAGSGQRLLYTQERPHFEAKNRFKLDEAYKVPDFMKSWEDYKQFCQSFYEELEK